MISIVESSRNTRSTQMTVDPSNCAMEPIPIPGKIQSHGFLIAELFKRLDNAAKYEGTGVGLAIVKRIMEKHRARIWYESALSQGTTFFLAFGR